MQDLNSTLKALQLGGMMVYPLLLLGVTALAIILDKAFVYWRFGRLRASTRELVGTDRFAWTQLDKEIMSLVPGSYYGRFFQVILNNRTSPSWRIESRANDEAQLIEKFLSRGIWVLETIVTAAPLLGLVGTIVGMMESFKLIGGSGLVNPIGITGGVAQALIATTLGLLIALIALFAYNFFSHLQSKTMDEMERLGTRLIDHIRMDQEGAEDFRETAYGSPIPSRAHRNHPDDRRDVLPSGDLYAGLSCLAESPFLASRSSPRQRRTHTGQIPGDIDRDEG